MQIEFLTSAPIRRTKDILPQVMEMLGQGFWIMEAPAGNASVAAATAAGPTNGLTRTELKAKAKLKAEAVPSCGPNARVCGVIVDIRRDATAADEAGERSVGRTTLLDEHTYTLLYVYVHGWVCACVAKNLKEL